MSGFWKGWIGSPVKTTNGKPTVKNGNNLPSNTKPPLLPAENNNVNKQLQHASAQTKADIQEIINKHQAAALLEANNKLRELLEEREDHLEQMKAQERMIQDLKECLKMQQLKEEKTQKINGDTNQELEEMRQQLREKDEIIQKLQQNQPQESNGKHRDNSSDNETIHKLSEQVKEQQEEIERLQRVLQEIEAFHSTHSEEGDALRPSLSLSPINESRPEDDDDDDEGEDDDENDDADQEDDSYSALSQLGSLPNHNGPTLKKYPQQMTLNGNQLVLLISSMPANNTVKANQKRLETVLQGLHLGPDEVQVLDGCDTTSVTLRNDLFAISGKHAIYPQLFLVNFQQNDIGFVGDFNTVMDLHDRNLLDASIGLTSLHSEA